MNPLHLLPCACVTFTYDHVTVSHDGQAIQCLWCAATFSVEDIRAWMHSGSNEVFQYGQAPKLMIMSRGKITEVSGLHLACGLTTFVLSEDSEILRN